MNLRTNLLSSLLLVIASAGTLADEPAKPHITEFIGHRGASVDAPENTLAAFKLCYAQGVAGCELDIRSTQDHRLIVIHDATTMRVAGVDKKVNAQTFSELRKLEAGQWGAWAGKGFSEKLPTLGEALATIPKGRKMYLHSYCDENDLPQIFDAVAESGKKFEQIVFISFHLDPCKQFKTLLPQCKAYWIQPFKEDTPAIDKLIAQAQAAGVDGLDLDFKFPIDQAFVDRVHGAGLELHVWTVDDPAVAAKLVAAGVDSITTNRPGWLRDQVTAGHGH